MSKTCAKCGGRMEQGFMLDNTDGGKKVTTWVEGAPQKKWYGLSTSKLRRFDIETWRCQRCFVLESYAPG